MKRLFVTLACATLLVACKNGGSSDDYGPRPLSPITSSGGSGSVLKASCEDVQDPTACSSASQPTAFPDRLKNAVEKGGGFKGQEIYLADVVLKYDPSTEVACSQYFMFTPAEIVEVNEVIYDGIGVDKDTTAYLACDVLPDGTCYPEDGPKYRDSGGWTYPAGRVLLVGYKSCLGFGYGDKALRIYYTFPIEGDDFYDMFAGGTFSWSEVRDLLLQAAKQAPKEGASLFSTLQKGETACMCAPGEPSPQVQGDLADGPDASP